jgi:hypothetical protein
MEDESSRERHQPDLTAWAAVDPARHPFDPGEALTVVRSVAPPQPSVNPDVARLGQWAGSEYWAARDEGFQWNMEMTDALVDHYGPWAHGWHWAPDPASHGDGQVRGWDSFGPIVTPPAETLVLVAAELVRWRQWLEEIAREFARLLPSLGREGTDPGDTAGWEAAIAHLLSVALARVQDGEGWRGRCAWVLTWFLTAAGRPEQHSATLTDEALAGSRDSWLILTTAGIVDVAERLAREITRSPDGPDPRPADWPDTWPQGWPSWRATNLGRQSGRSR